MKTIKIAKGNAFDLVVPLVLINDTIDPTKITDLQAIVKTSKGDAVECTIAADSNNAVITFADLLGLGSYDVQIYGKYNARKFAILFNNCFAIAEWSNGCNYDYKITPEIVVTDPQPLVGWYATDAELDQLKADYLAAIQAEQAAAEELQEKVQMLDGVAQQGNDPTATNSEILYQITHLVVPPPTGVAQQSTLTEGIADIRNDIAGIDIDTTTLAKESQVKDGNDTAISVAKEVRSELGTGSDSASETGTLFAVVKWIKDKVKAIYNALTDNASGLGVIASDAAAAASDAAAAKTAAQAITGYALQGSDNTATNTAIMAAIPSVAGLATESNATANKNAILQAIADNAGVPMLTIPNTTTSQELAPNTCYIFENRSNALLLTLGSPIVGIANEYHFFIVTDTTAPTIIFPTGITWNGGSAPTIAASKTYEISILNNVAAYFEI